MPEPQDVNGSVEFKLEPWEHTRLTRLLSRGQRLVCFLLFASVAVFAASQGQRVTAVGAALFACVPTLMLPGQAHRARQRDPWSTAPTRWTWEPGVITVESPLSRTTFLPGSVQKVQRRGGFLIVWITPGQSLILPERALPDSDAMESLLRVVLALQSAPSAQRLSEPPRRQG